MSNIDKVLNDIYVLNRIYKYVQYTEQLNKKTTLIADIKEKTKYLKRYNNLLRQIPFTIEHQHDINEMSFLTLRRENSKWHMMDFYTELLLMHYFYD